jgi:hypothetical protein
MDDDAQIVSEVRQQSRRFVQSVFTGFALIFAALAMAAHHAPTLFSIPEGDMPRMAVAFLFLSSAYTLTLFVWDWLFEPRG